MVAGSSVVDLLKDMMEANHRQVLELVKAIKDESGVLDRRGFGKGPVYTGDINEFHGWWTRTRAILESRQVSCREAFDWSIGAKHQISDSAIFEHFGDKSQVFLRLSRDLFTHFIETTEGEAAKIVMASEGVGQEAVRLLHARYSPRTASRKRALLRKILNFPCAESIEEVHAKLVEYQALVRQFEQLTEWELNEDVKIVGVVDLCPREVRENVERTTAEASYEEVKAEIVRITDRQRTFPDAQFAEPPHTSTADIGALSTTSRCYRCGGQ